MIGRSFRRTVTMAVAAILLVIWLILCIKVNVEHPPVPLEIYHENDTFVFKNREITLVNTTMLSGEETKPLLKETDEYWYKEIIESYAPERIRMLLMTVTVKNVGNSTLEHALGGLYGQLISPVDTLSYPYDDVSSMLNQKALGDDWAMLEVGEQKEYAIAYFLDSSWMSKARWAQVETMPYENIIASYPVEIRISTAKAA